MVSLLIVLITPAFAAEKGEDPIKRTVLKVQKLTCGACLSRIKSALSPIKGFSAMRSNLRRKLVAVEATAPLESKKIAETITSLGYPAQIVSVTDIDKSETFTSQPNTANAAAGRGGSCCSTSTKGYGSSDPGAGNSQAAQLSRSSCCSTGSQQKTTATGVGCSGSGRGCGYSKRGCGASSEAWKALIRQYFKEQKQFF